MHSVDHQHSKEGKGQVGEDRQDLTFCMHLDKLKAVLHLEPKVTAERQLECHWESISSKDLHSVFSSFGPSKVM